ncbi:MAG: endolytic transglycosylase MltG, partial [Clostridia bacterium]|nr:endolytic transglycosylase MltG [Clostridia bacterium]
MEEKWSADAMDDEARLEGRRKRVKRRKAWKGLRPFIIGALSVGICVAVLWGGLRVLLREYVYPVNEEDATPITVIIEKGSGASTIAKVLYEACGEGEQGLIRSKAAFKIYVDFTGKASTLQAGTYILSKNMDIAQIVDVICMGNPPRQTAKFTIPEGMEIADIAEKLVKEGILSDTSKFLELCKTGEEFKEYGFVTAILSGGDAAQRDYVLEGYLFPDTYQIYTDSSEKTIITKMLLRFNDVFTDEYLARAQELGMSVDEVVTLASMIEKEAKTADFSKVSAVFHNRLEKDMRLESDAPLKYIFKTKGVLDFTSEQMQSDSPYNTYT